MMLDYLAIVMLHEVSVRVHLIVAVGATDPFQETLTTPYLPRTYSAGGRNIKKKSLLTGEPASARCYPTDTINK